MERDRLLEIIRQAGLTPEPHRFNYVPGGPVHRCVSLHDASPLLPQFGMLAAMIRNCASVAEAGDLIERASHTRTTTGVDILYWRFADWPEEIAK